MAALDADIGAVADHLIEALRLAEALPAKAGDDRPKAEDVRFMAYALATFRTRRGGVLTEDHLRLLAAALQVRRPSLAAGEFVGLPRVKKLDAFLAAADRQGSELAISEIGLARAVGVEARTIRAWRAR